MIHPVVAFALAIGVAVAGGIARWLTPGGVLAAIVVGGIILSLTGWIGGGMLVTLFVLGSGLSTLSARRRGRSSGPRHAVQVLANGGVAAAASLAGVNGVGRVAVGAALAVAAADTAATEIGALSRRPPRLITTGREVSPGRSGGVTRLGSAGALLGAGAVAAVGWLLGAPLREGAIVLGAGFTGAFVDSWLGATAQATYRCARCAAVTEQPRHDCGEACRLVSGVPWITNDAVNFLATLWGAAVAWFLVMQ